MDIKQLSLEEKIGQLFMVGINGKTPLEVKSLIKDYKIGGVVVYRKNYNNYKEMVELINNIKSMNSKNNIPIFISIDQEGGRVNRMPSEILNLPSAIKLAKLENKEVLKESGNIIGEMLRKTGITMDYAPILDIKRFDENHAIGNRCYGENKEDVEKYAIEVMKGIQEEKVISVIKHFPGHGSTKKDSHFRIPKITEKILQLEKEDMDPFKKAIEDGADAIMVGHLILKDVDKKYPASLSKKIIQTYLVDKYNYKGLIITDDLKMMAIRIHYNMNKAVLKAINAGNDIIMIGLSYNKIKRITKYIIKKVKKGKILVEDIDKKIEKIIEMKKKYNVTDDKIEGIIVEDVNKRIQNLREQVTK